MDFEVLWPLGCKREDAWFCYVMPYPTLNPGKIGLIKANYTAVAESYNLPECSIPIFNPAEFRKQSRLKEILIELKQSQADTIVLLGDIPIKHFLSHFSEFKSLKDFEKGLDNFGRLIHYGKKQKIEIAGKLYNVIPLIDPEHYSTTGNTSQKDCHIYWMGKGTIIQMKISSEGKDPSYVTKKPVVCPICFCRKIVTFANEKPPFSEKTKRAIREGRLILKDKEIKSEDVKYFCTECGFEFYEIQD